MVIEIATMILLVLCSLFSDGVCDKEFLKQPASISTKVESNIPKIQGRKQKMFGIKDSTAKKFNPSELHVSQPRELCHAVVRTKANDAKKFMGAGATLALYKPNVQNNQWSSSRIKLSNGDDSIETGFMVNPEVFKDNEAHSYAKFSAGGRGCINKQCPGFVEVSPGYLGITPDHYTTIGSGYYWECNVTIDKHQDDGHWWLSVIYNNTKIFQIGYWPKSLFSSPLAEVASQIEWGGEINNPGTSASQPEMGNGYKAVNINATHFRQVTTVNESFQKVPSNDFEVFQDCSPFYTAQDYGYYDETWGHLITFGGPHE
ncbi:hypothetical protein RND81_04G186800 [Saponaria officinalis]|uniref:Neprosin PEP catalytic domain-containing protein n=1 Tax=Saponaria officinalis TaxID=3572 RepID=A0AAW1LKY6_SAPOF